MPRRANNSQSARRVRILLRESASSISIIVTSVPKRSKIEANSQPMIPPPRTTRRFGTSVCARRPVESTQRRRLETRYRRHDRLRPVATIALLKLRPISPLSKERAPILETGAALEPRHVVGLEERSDAAGHLLDDLRLPLVGLGEVELGLAADDAELRAHLTRRMERVRGRDPCLRRNAPDAEARPAELCLALDAGDARAELRRPDRRV